MKYLPFPTSLLALLALSTFLSQSLSHPTKRLRSRNFSIPSQNEIESAHRLYRRADTRGTNTVKLPEIAVNPKFMRSDGVIDAGRSEVPTQGQRNPFDSSSSSGSANSNSGMSSSSGSGSSSSDSSSSNPSTTSKQGKLKKLTNKVKASLSFKGGRKLKKKEGKGKKGEKGKGKAPAEHGEGPSGHNTSGGQKDAGTQTAGSNSSGSFHTAPETPKM